MTFACSEPGRAGTNPSSCLAGPTPGACERLVGHPALALLGYGCFMQQLLDATNTGHMRKCASDILYGVPCATGFIRRHMRKHRKGLSVPQFRTLVWVGHHPSHSLSALAEHLGATLPTTSRIVEGLVARGLLSRTGRTDDRRQVALGITPAGREVLDPAWSATRREVELRLADLSADDQATISRAMQLLVVTLGGEDGWETPPDTTKD